MSDTAEHATVEPETAEGPIEADTGTHEATEEQLRRRDEALAKVVTFGDPVLRSRASEVREFGPELAAEAERMVAIMRDAMGVGLAATQLGSLRRLLVFQAGPDATPMRARQPGDPVDAPTTSRPQPRAAFRCPASSSTSSGRSTSASAASTSRARRY